MVAQFTTMALAMGMFLLRSPIQADDSRPTAEMQELVNAMKEGLKSNREQLGRVEARLTSVLISPDVKEARRVTETFPDGTEISYDEAPRFDTPIQIVLDGEKIRHTILDKDKNPKQITIFDGKRWTQYIPNDGLAWIRTSEQMGDTMAREPNEFGLPSHKQTLIDLLTEAKPLFARRERQAKGGEIVKVEIRHPKNGRWYFEFDAAAGYLPRTIAVYNSEETGFGLITFRTHQPVEGRKAWFLKEADQYFIHGDKTGEPVVPRKYHQKASLIVESVTVFDADNEIEQETPFQIDLPQGTGIRDVANRRSYQKGAPNDPNGN